MPLFGMFTKWIEEKDHADSKQKEKGNEEESTEKTLADELKDKGLDPKHWLGILENQIGVTNNKQLSFVGLESFEKLKGGARHEWEENALKDLLNIKDEEHKSYRKEKKEDKTNRQAKITKIVDSLEELQKNNRLRSDESVKKIESELCKVLDVPDEVWIQKTKDKSLNTVIADIKSQIDDSGDLVKREEELSAVELVECASGGLALRGILVTRNPKDLIERRSFLIEAPQNIKLRSPIFFQKDDVIENNSKTNRNIYHQSCNMLGHSLSGNIDVGLLGLFSIKAGGDKSHEEENKDTETSQNEIDFHQKILISFFPAASIDFYSRKLKISPEALVDLKMIESLLVIDLLEHTAKLTLRKVGLRLNEYEQIDEYQKSKLITKQCMEFFDTYGSHVNTGTIHFGGIYKWEASYEDTVKSNKTTTANMVQDVLNGSIAAGGLFEDVVVGVGFTGMHTKGKAKFVGSYEDEELAKIELKSSKQGGPQEVASLPKWKFGLMSNNRTWAVIDRGSSFVRDLMPIWKLIRYNAIKFEDADLLSKIMEQAWEMAYKYTKQ